MIKTLQVLTAVIISLTTMAFTPPVWSQGTMDPRLPSLERVRAALSISKPDWIKFRNYSGRQLAYFTGLVTWKCGLATIEYGVNGGALSQRFPLPECNPQLPYNIGAGDQLYLSFPLHTVRTLSVRLTYRDGSKSAVRGYKPCYVKGDVTCGVALP